MVLPCWSPARRATYRTSCSVLFCFRSFAPCLRSRGSAGRPARWNSLRIFRAGCCAAERFGTRAKPHVCLRLCALREGGSQAAAREDSNGSDELEEEAEEEAEESDDSSGGSDESEEEAEESA